MKKSKKLVSFLMAIIMLVTFALPASALEIEPPGEIIHVSDGSLDEVTEPISEAEETTANTSTEGGGDESTDAPTEAFDPTEGEDVTDATDPIEEATVATPTDVTEPTEPVEPSDPGDAEDGSFLLDCTPEQAEAIIRFYEALAEQIENPPIRPYVSDGDSGSVSWTWGESVNIDVPSGDPGNPYHIGNIPRITLSTSDMPIGRPFCAEFGPDPGGSYTASEGGDSEVLALLVAFEEGSASAVGVQLALWYLLDGIPLASQPQAASALSAASGADTTGYTYYEWSGSGQPFVTLDYAEEEPPDPTDPSGSEPTEPPTEPTNPNTRTEVTTDTETRTEIRSETTYEYSDAIGQITVAKRDEDGESLDGAIFKIDVQFANGQRGGDSAFEIYNGSRLFTWTHPADDHEPAKVTVTEVRAPDGYIGDFTPQTATVHPTYTRITKVLTHTITITTTTTTTSVIDIDTGEVLSESSASADAETELDPPVIQEYPDFIAGDREITLTYVNTIKAAELVIFKYTTGVGTPLQGAQFEVSYVDPSVHSGRWTVTTGADGKAVISLPKPGAVLIHEVSPPAGHIISPTYGPDTTVTIQAGERKQVDIPNDPYTAVEVLKIDSVTGEPLAGATISIKHVSSGMEFRQVTGEDGVARFENVEPGSWYAEEIKAPDRYVLNTTRYPIQLKSNEVATVTIPDDPYTGIEITKVDANNGQVLAGAYIRLKHISSGQEYSGVTGADGTVYFGKIPPGDYYAEETQPPFGYTLNDTRYPLELKTGELATLTISNFRKDGLYIRKVDQDGKPLPGAVFELRRGSGEVILRDTTDANGQIFREFFTTDTYIVEEISAPVGYLMDANNPQSIFIDEEDDNKLYTLTFVNLKKPSIEVIKVDANDPNKRLQGAVFRISEQGGSKTWDITTGFDGTALLENLEIGTTYIVEEKTPPRGYASSGYKEAIVLNECRTHTVTVANDPLPGLVIEKLDEATGQKLPGAVFRVAERGGSEYTDVTTGFDGTATLEQLSPGWFVVSELRAPSGYLLDAAPHEIEVKAGENAVLTVTNRKQPTLTITKIDEQTGDALPGAVLRVAPKSGGEHTDITTGMGGTAVVSLSPGWFVITEIRAPSGYVLDSTPHEIEIKPGENAAITVKNSKDPQLIIKKIDEQTGDVLPGAVFRIAPNAGGEYTDVTTGADGIAAVSDLAPGWYTVTERQAPEDYILDSTPKTVELTAGADAEIIIQNRKRPSLTIVKLDNVTKQPLQHARFRVSLKEGKTLGEYTSGADGKIVLDNLDPGLYLVDEIAAPSGYNMLEGAKEIRLDWGKDAVIEVPNEPINPLLIKKVDAMTGEPLSGAKFIVTKVNGEAVGEYETGQSGYITVTGLTPGWYTAKESKAPLGYILDDTPKQVELTLDDPAIIEFEDHPLNGLLISKIDSVTKQPLAGAKFKIMEKGGKLIGEYTTDSNGEIALDGLEPGWFTLTETAAPEGYAIDSTPKDVEFVWGENTIVEFTNDRKPPLEIMKIDADTGEPLPGAKFRVTTMEGTFVAELTTDRYGLAVADDLTAGWYLVTELQAPEGYLLDSAPRSVEVKANIPATVEITNTKLATLQIRKTDAESGEPLPGAHFRIVTTEGTLIGEHISGADGLIHLSGLHPGSYVVTEIKCPDGYRIDPAPRTVVLKAGETASLAFENARLPGLQVKKTDTKTGEPLSGAKFAVAKMNGAQIGEYTTNSAGFFVVPELPAGWYTVFEKQAPAGYITDPTPQNVELELNSTAVVEFSNKPLAGLQIQKLDEATGLPMAGVAFDVAELNGKRIGSFTTDENGQIFVPDLQEGWLVITETKTLPGYKPDTAPRNVEVLSGELNTLVVKNQPYPYLQINKTDSETGKPIPGVSFKVFDKQNRELGEFTTNELGVIMLTGMEAGTFYIRETKAAEGYVLDETVKEVTLFWGRTTVIEAKNTPMASLTIRKIDALTKKPLAGAGFILYDAEKNIVGECVSDENGLISFPRSLPAGKYELKETEAPEGYVLPEKPVSITLKAGETQEIEFPNDPVRGKIQIIKKAAADNPLTDDEKGDVLVGAEFEILNEDEDVVDTITTDSKGVAETVDLPIGEYAIRETAAPELYILNDSVFYGEIKLHGDVVRFEVLNTPAELGVTIEKTGNVEAVAGDVIRYDFANISNTSNIALEEFYWHELLPTDAVRLETISTGTWSAKLNYKVVYKTNRKTQYRVWKDKLSSATNNTLSVKDLNLSADEYVTEFKLELGTVEPGFHETEAPFITTRVLEDLPHENRFVNKTDVGGKYGDEFIVATDEWVVIAFSAPKGPLPQTGW